MNRLSSLFSLSVGLVAILGVNTVNAALQPTPVVPAFEATGEMLMANRLRNRGLRFHVRPSRYRYGGFVRGSCPQGAAPIVPITEDKTYAPSYLTASAHPTFFINVPELPDASGFIYVDNPDLPGRNPQLYKVAFDLDGGAGIVGIQMPKDAPGLEVGSSYRWRVAIDCSSAGAEGDTIVFKGGEVERVADIEGATEQRLEYYLQEGIWQETAEIVAKDRYNAPSAGSNEDWAALMEESGLSQFADTPIVAIVEGRLEN